MSIASRAAFIPVLIALSTCPAVAQDTVVVSSVNSSIELGVGSVAVQGYYRSSASTASTSLTVVKPRLLFGTAAGLTRFASGNISGYGQFCIISKIVHVTDESWLSLESDASSGIYRGTKSNQYLTTGLRYGGVTGPWASIRWGFARGPEYTYSVGGEVGFLTSRRSFDIFTSLSLAELHDRVYGKANFGLIGKFLGVEWNATTGLSMEPSGSRIGHFIRIAEFSGMRRLTNSLSLTVAGGRTSNDFVRAIPSARYVSVGMRLSRSHKNVVPGALPVIIHQGTTFSSPDTNGLSTITIKLPQAKSADIMGDFTEWRPVAMEYKGGTWVASIKISKGIHRLNVRIDDGPWQIPPGLPAVDDDFGGVAGIFVFNP